MGDIEPSSLRISDTEREQAIQLLGEHMSLGRLDVEEYGERSARATAAKTRGELTELFTDLPDPRPAFGPAPAPPPVVPAAAPPPVPARVDTRTVMQRAWGALVPLSALASVLLFFTVFEHWFVFLLPAALAVVGGAIWGDDWKHDRRHHDRHLRHQQRRELRRGWHD